MPTNGAGNDMCAIGVRHSPIDIEDTDAARVLRLGFKYKLSLVTLSQSDRGVSGAYVNGRSVYVGTKGTFLRLGVRATDSRSARWLCSQLKSSSQCCIAVRTGRS